MASIQQLANNLKFLRTITGRTQDDLAAYLNISRQAYSHYETSKRTPDPDTLLRLSSLYHVSVDVLLGIDLTAYSAKFAESAAKFAESGMFMEDSSSYSTKALGEDLCLLQLTKEEAEFITKLRLLPPAEREKFFRLSDIFFHNP